MKLMKTAGLIAAAFGLVALMGGEAYAQAPTLTATLTGPRSTISWTAIAGGDWLRSVGWDRSRIVEHRDRATARRVPRGSSLNPVPPGTYYLRVRGSPGHHRRPEFERGDGHGGSRAAAAAAGALHRSSGPDGDGCGGVVARSP